MFIVAELVPIDGGTTKLHVWGKGITAHAAQQDALHNYCKILDADTVQYINGSYQMLLDGVEEAGNELVTSENAL